MGGGAGYEAVNSVIKCHGGQLFDESLGACSSTMKSCPTGGGSSSSSSSSSGSSPSSTVSKPKPSSISSTRRPTDKPIQQYYPNPPTHQPVESDNPVPNPGAPSSAQTPNGQAASAIVESATSSSNTAVVDNEGEDWSQQVVSTTTTTTPQPTSKPESIMDWIPAAPSPPASSTSTSTNINNNDNNDKNNRCTSNNDCLSYNNSPYNICNQPNPLEAGYCGQCLTFNGMGCSTSEICQSTSIIQTSTQSESVLGGGGGGKCRSYNGFGITHEVGITKCFTKSVLDYDCQVILNDVEATCNVNLMICEGTAHTESSVIYDHQQQQQQEQQTVDGISSSSVAAAAVILTPPPSTSNPTPQPISSPVAVPIVDKEEESVTSSSSAQPTLSFLSAIMSSSTSSSQQQVSVSSQQQSEQTSASQTSSSSTSQQTEQQQPPVVVIPETAPEAIPKEEPTTTMIVCNLCGTDTTTTVLNPSQVVSLDGNAYMKCEELTQIFTSQSITEGSTRCLNFRGQFYNPCCIEKNANEDDEVVGGASSIVSSQESAAEEDDDISSDMCSVCRDPNLNTMNSGGMVFFMGEEITCDELGNRVYTKIRFDSSDCEVAQRSYSGTCCTSLDGTFNTNNINVNSPVGTSPTPSPHSSTTAKPHYLSNWNTNVIMSPASRTCLASFILSFCLPIAVGIILLCEESMSQ